MSLKSRQGLTFIELIFVMLALSVLVVAALPNMQAHWSRLQIERTAFDLAQSLRTARVLAVTQSQQVNWIWDEQRRRICLGTEQASTCASDQLLPGRFGQPKTIPSNIHLTFQRQPQVPGSHEEQPSIRFFPDGTSQGTLLSLGEAETPRYTITVDETTAHVVVQPASLPAPR